jgi:hypothetical protein
MEPPLDIKIFIGCVRVHLDATRLSKTISALRARVREGEGLAPERTALQEAI